MSSKRLACRCEEQSDEAISSCNGAYTSAHASSTCFALRSAREASLVIYITEAAEFVDAMGGVDLAHGSSETTHDQ